MCKQAPIVKAHDIKVSDRYYQSELRRRWTIRRNDRDYRVGDYIVVREFDGEFYSGRYYAAQIVDIFSGDYLAPGHVILDFCLVRARVDDAGRLYLDVSIDEAN